MLLDRSERFIVSSVGWVDHGGFVHRDLESNAVYAHPCEGGEFVKLDEIDGDRFLCVVYSWERKSVRFEVRRFAELAGVLWSLDATLNKQTISGDPVHARGVPRFQVAPFSDDTATGRLIELAPDFTSAKLHALPWYGDNYDLGYQGLTDAIALPGTERVLVSVQRSSTIVLHDLTTGDRAAEFGLADRGGNPELHIVGDELWTIDYDTFVRVDLRTFQVVASVLLQPSAGGTRQFVGDLSFIASRNKIAVARPFSGDVVIVDPQSCRIEQTIAIGRQPLVCAVTSTGQLVARDWKTADWLAGSVLFEQSKSWWRPW